MCLVFFVPPFHFFIYFTPTVNQLRWKAAKAALSVLSVATSDLALMVTVVAYWPSSSNPAALATALSVSAAAALDGASFSVMIDD